MCTVNTVQLLTQCQMDKCKNKSEKLNNWGSNKSEEMRCQSLDFAYRIFAFIKAKHLGVPVRSVFIKETLNHPWRSSHSAWILY